MIGVPLGILLLVVLLFITDTILNQNNTTRNTTLYGSNVGGLDNEQLLLEVGFLAEEFTQTLINIETPENKYAWSAQELGIRVDSEATVTEALKVGKGFWLFRPVTWFTSLVTGPEAHFQLVISEHTLKSVLSKSAAFYEAPTEPSTKISDSKLVVLPGIPGRDIDIDDAISKIIRVLKLETSPTVNIKLKDIQPTVSEYSVQEAVDNANKIINKKLRLQSNNYETDLTPALIASWFTLQISPKYFNLYLDEQKVFSGVQSIMQAGDIPAGEPFLEPQGEDVIIDWEKGSICCHPEVSSLVVKALTTESDEVSLIKLPNQPAPAPENRIRALKNLGISELVSTFTTRHSCCQGRVQNIQRFADHFRGTIIEPDEVLSLNSHVGRRTEESGFVLGGAIQNGVLVETVGGGVSQFTTTIFNAALLAGLKFDYYQAHSLYFPRYPYGREATISYPSVDLKIRNTTPFSILIWPSYTSESITVDFYSTKHLDVTFEAPIEKRVGLMCTRVRTKRVTTSLNGDIEEDFFGALYHYKHGIRCDGSSSDPDAEMPTEPSTLDEPGSQD
ncbi:MAG: VanW family protein [Actinomycetota bacterium]|nr:VanW family protein [Actinomycetota bacterium]MDG2121281.1 VanW family protein [Actinomycetota bacterium]